MYVIADIKYIQTIMAITATIKAISANIFIKATIVMTTSIENSQHGHYETKIQISKPL